LFRVTYGASGVGGVGGARWVNDSWLTQQCFDAEERRIYGDFLFAEVEDGPFVRLLVYVFNFKLLTGLDLADSLEH